jgi:hypothetical protein
MPLDSTNWAEIEIDEPTALLIRAREFIERGWCRYFLRKKSARDTRIPDIPMGGLVVCGRRHKSSDIERDNSGNPRGLRSSGRRNGSYRYHRL